MSRFFIALATIACALQWTVMSAPAHAATAVLSGVVVANGSPVTGVAVTVEGANVAEHTATDEHGRFHFVNLSPGSYVISASAPEGSAKLAVDLPSVGADVTLVLGPQVLGVVPVTAASTLRGAGTDLTLARVALTRSPAAGTFPSLLVQLPGAARGANGVVHINGDHGDINYVIDGVPIPQELNRNIGTEFNPNDVSFVDVLEGAYPAQYGERFASVLNIDTRSSAGLPGLSGGFSAGSFGHTDATLDYENRVGAGSLVTALRNTVTQRGLDPPNATPVHDNASDANQFVRYTLPHGNDYLNFIFSHSYQTYQLPLDLAGGQPPASDDNENQDDLFTAIQMRHAGARQALSYGIGYKDSRIRDFGDAANDWTYGEALYAASGGSATDCFNALTIAVYTNGTCAYSLSSDRRARDYRLNLDDAVVSDRHEVRWGAAYDTTTVDKQYAVTLQPENFLARMFTPATPDAPYAVVDNAPNIAHAEEAYVQDSWRFSPDYELDYGLRSDSFQLRSTEFERGFAMLSPRLKATRFVTPRSSIYVYYGRFFTPFSFENVSPTAAFLLNLPLQRQTAAFDLKPQRDSVYEIGGHLPLAGGDLGLRVMQKNATDLIDDTQVGVTLLHQDINYQLGRIATQSAYYQHALARQGSLYVTVNHTYSVNKGCETQLLAPCFGSPTDWTPADHEQRWGSTAGVLLNDTRGGWFALDAEYGSGLSSAGCPPGTPGFCKYTPHTTIDVVRGIAMSPQTKLTLRVVNLLNHEYLITYLNAQGNHWYTRRALEVGLQFTPRSR